jgi:hypothetical protein
MYDSGQTIHCLILSIQVSGEAAHTALIKNIYRPLTTAIPSYFFFPNFVRNTYHNEPVMHTDEYAPQTIPTINGSANSRIELTPNTYRIATIIKVVNDV